MTVFQPDWLTKGPVATILTLLNQGGEEARVVGGAVRNLILGKPQADIDIATTATPDVVIARARAAGIRTEPTGIDHGTVMLILDNRGYEVTTLRQDIETDGRHAVVRFGRDFAVDAERRDFTVNAMSLAADGTLFDYFGGQEDAKGGRIRFIGKAETRIREDYLRILRFFRFHAHYGHGAPDKAGLDACIAGRDGLAGLSRERVQVELMKLLAAPSPSATARIMSDAGFFLLTLGGVTLPQGLARLEAIEKAMSLPPDPVQRMGALAILIREDAERLRQRLRLSNEAFRRLDGIGHGAWRIDPALGEKAARAMLYVNGPRGYRDRAMVAFARSGAAPDDPAWQSWLTLPDRYSAPAFPVSGDDLQLRGVPRGPELGEMLSRIKIFWLEAGLPTDRETVLSLISKAMIG